MSIGQSEKSRLRVQISPNSRIRVRCDVWHMYSRKMFVTNETGRGLGETARSCPLRILNNRKEREREGERWRERDGNHDAATRHSSTFVN